MKLPWVSREAYELALKQIEDLKASNVQLVELATTRSELAHTSEPEQNILSTKPHRRLVKELREIAETDLRERHIASKAR